MGDLLSFEDLVDRKQRGVFEQVRSEGDVAVAGRVDCRAADGIRSGTMQLQTAPEPVPSWKAVVGDESDYFAGGSLKTTIASGARSEPLPTLDHRDSRVAGPNVARTAVVSRRDDDDLEGPRDVLVEQRPHGCINAVTSAVADDDHAGARSMDHRACQSGRIRRLSKPMRKPAE